MFCEDYDALEKRLTQLGYIVHAAEDRQAAAKLVCGLIGTQSVGCGGSVTLNELDLPKALIAQGATVYSHWLATSPAERVAAQKAAHFADWYLSSTNAFTRNGELVNIDGNGNRVCGMIDGPERVIVVASKNKLVQDVAEGYKRTKEIAAPLNTKRIGCKTPCVVTGKCADCNSPGRICCVTTILHRPTMHHKEFHLVLVDEELGY